jgi:hypothetical protein
MSWNALRVTIRARNVEGSLTFKDIILDCLGAEPFFVMEEGDIEDDVAGYRDNPITYRREYDFAIRSFSVSDTDWDHADYERMMMYLRASYLEIVAVEEPEGPARRTMKQEGEPLNYWFWTTESETILPVAVRVKSLDKPESSVGSGRFKVFLTLEDVLPTIGVTI